MPTPGIALLGELVQDFQDHGVWECVGPAGYQRVASNVSSACLPYASTKRLASVSAKRDRAGIAVFAVMKWGAIKNRYIGSFSNSV